MCLLLQGNHSDHLEIILCNIKSFRGAFTKDVRLTPPGGGSEKPVKTGRWEGGGEGVIEILGRPKAN